MERIRSSKNPQSRKRREAERLTWLEKQGQLHFQPFHVEHGEESERRDNDEEIDENELLERETAEYWQRQEVQRSEQEHQEELRRASRSAAAAQH